MFLNDGVPPILFTLGTAAVHVAGDFFHHAAEACRILNRRGLLLIGPERQPPPNMPHGTQAFPYIPFSSVMPRCALNVHHGGIGSTAQALRAGKPTLVIPHAHDQFDNAARLQRLGLSETLPRARVNARRLAHAIAALLENHDAAARAQRVADAVALEHGALRAAQEVERFISPPGPQAAR
jgi:UDP:flavonoid glycosyltransferase YjiC (YdhE family)